MIWLAAALVIAQTTTAASPVKHVDHVMFTGGPELSALVAILRDQLELPIAFEGPKQTPPFPGICVSFGNMCLEILPLPPSPDAAEPRRASLGNLALQAADFKRTPDALLSRQIEHFPPDPQARWTTIGLRGIGIGFFIEYHDGMAARRERFQRELDRRQGGALGIVRVIEITRRSARIAEVRPAWVRLLGEPVPGDANLWRLEDGLGIRLIGSDDPRANRVVAAVRSLNQARAALTRLKIPFSSENGDIVIDPKALHGLSLVLR